MVAALLFTNLSAAGAAPPVPPPDVDQRVAAAASAAPESVAPDQRTAVLGDEWAVSADRAVTTAGDASGFHVLVAHAKDGYQWRTAASLSEPGFDTDGWIGNLCVTASGDRAVVAYAPRTFTNKEHLAQRGAFTAIVDLNGGPVRKLSVQTSLAYFNPGCGPTESAVLTQEGTEDLDRTRLLVLDTVTGATAKPIEVPGQLTSPVPTSHGIVAADSGAVVRVAGDGTRTVLAPAKGVPYRLSADADGGVVFAQTESDKSASIQRVTVPPRGRGTLTMLATGALMDVNVRSARGGQVFVTGKKSAHVRATPASVRLADVPTSAEPSLDGDLAVTSVLRTHTKDPRVAPADPMSPQRVDITTVSLDTGKEFTLSAVPTAGAAGGGEGSPALPSGKAAGDPNDPADGDQRYCSVPRNDPQNQAMQPKPRQVEWAVDQAVRGVLTVQRPANWKNLGMPAYTPQGLSPPQALAGGGYLPAQVMLGVLAQESNMWQAARYAVPGVTANPLIGNYFGIDYYNDTPSDDWSINWNEADCGYGVGQVTDGMRLAGKGKPGEIILPWNHQRAIALDFAANIAKGVQILQSKWNQTRAFGLVINNGEAKWIENWFFAVWAYNSGFYQQSDSGSNDGAWGVGWLNNPANPRYPSNRTPFLDDSYGDAAHPQDWPYPEKVMGWAGHPIELIETPGNLVHGYRAAWWLTEEDRWNVKPGIFDFCDDSNNCNPGAEIVPDDPDVIGEPAGPCAHRNSNGKYDLKCWYHEPRAWKSCEAQVCGNELLRFDPGYAYQEDATSYPPVCTKNGLPTNASVVDNLPQSVPSIRPGCTKPPSDGAFTFTFKSTSNGNYPGKIDVHQIGAAYGGHFWMSNTHRDAAREAVGTWRLNRTHSGPMRIMVYLPDPGARTNEAHYQVNSTRGGRTRTINQSGAPGNRWVDIGTYMFDGAVPTVSLSNLTEGGDGTQRIAWDAVAFIPVTGQYHHEAVEAVAVFDEDQNIDTAAPGSWIAGPLASRQDLFNWASSTTGDILGMVNCPPETVGDCLLPQTRRAISDWRDQVVTAGTDPTNHPDGTSIGTWISFAQPYTDRPTTDQRPSYFSDDNRFKIRLEASVSFITGGDGRIIAGSEFAVYRHRTGNTHLPMFVTDFIRAIESDYGIAPPNLTYRMPDLNAHDGVWRTADPLTTGVLPGRAYAYAGKAPVPVDPSGAPSQDNANCVAALTVAGGSIGYRPMLSQSGPVDAMADWVSRIEDDPRTPDHLAGLAEDIREMFFDDGVAPGAESSIFTQAPPIWQELNFKACADGTIQKIQDRPLLRASFMPDQYLYHNGRAMDLNGAYSGSNQPVMSGDFQSFSRLPFPFPPPSPYEACDFATGRSGNPWDISAIPPEDPGVNPPRAHFCLDKNLPSDQSHSS
jgi:hypothetical protein